MDCRLSRASQTVAREARGDISMQEVKFYACSTTMAIQPSQETKFSACSKTKSCQTLQKIKLFVSSTETYQAGGKNKIFVSSPTKASRPTKMLSLMEKTSKSMENTRLSASFGCVAAHMPPPITTNSQKHQILNPSIWRQLLSKHVMASKHGEEPQPRPEEVQSDKEVLLDLAPSAADPHMEDFGFSDLHKVLAAPVEHLKESWNQVSEISRDQGEMTRRRVLGTPMYMSLACMLGSSMSDRNAHALVRAVIDASKAPSKPFDPADKRLQEAAVTFQNALDASTVVEEEQLWTEVIEKYGSLEAEWVADIVSRAYGNRGNARSRQGKLDQALEDYDKSILLAPYAVDPVLNRGVVLESLGRYDEASADYVAVLRAQPKDPAAWNNLGNVKAAQNRWEDALIGYAKAMELAPVFSFAAANYALALYQVGRVNEAVKQFRSLLRKYPEFPDMRAALAVALYADGLTAEAESNWERLEDRRYRDRAWVKNTRRWPPRLVNDLEAFLDVRSLTGSSV